MCLRKRLKYLYLSKKRNTFASEKNWNTFISEKDYLIIMSHWVKIIKPQFSSFCLISPHNRLILPHNRLILPHNCLILPHFASNRLRCCLNLPQNDSESPPRNNVSIFVYIICDNAEITSVNQITILLPLLLIRNFNVQFEWQTRDL